MFDISRCVKTFIVVWIIFAFGLMYGLSSQDTEKETQIVKYGIVTIKENDDIKYQYIGEMYIENDNELSVIIDLDEQKEKEDKLLKEEPQN